MSDVVINLENTQQATAGIEAVELEVVKKEPEVPMIDVLAQELILLEDCVIVKIGKGAAETEKRISYEDFKTILNTALGRREDEKLDGFHLPSNCFYFAKSASAIQISCYYQERTADIKYMSSTMTIRVPNIIISHTLTRHPGGVMKLTGTRYFCTDVPVNRLPQDKFINQVENSKRIFLNPFSNTYNEGHMCYGGNSMPQTYNDNNLRGLDYYYQFLFNSPFNNDLGISAVSNTYVENWYMDLADVAKQPDPKFPYNRLRGAQ
ncbi:hypothetical protein D3C87_459840 [compost metagenome]